MSKPYSDRRWWDDPKPITSECCSCIYYLKQVNCEKYPDRIPDEVLDQSFPPPGKKKNKKYCEYRKEKK